MTTPRDRIRELRRVPARDLHPNPLNWRRHPKAQSTALLGMLAEVGFADAVIAYQRPDGELELIDGHLRQELAAPAEMIPTLILDVTEEEAAKLLMTMDPLVGMAETDRQMLTRLRDTVQLEDQRLSGLMDAINREYSLQDYAPAPRAGEEPPTEVEPRTQPGDLWTLGPHRILCADATDGQSYRRLLGGEGTSLVFTDPPYGVDYAAANFERIANDDKQRAELERFLYSAFREIARTLLPNAAAYVWHASATRDEYSTALKRAGFAELQYLIWVKPTLVLGHADYQWQHEPCFYAAQAGHRPPFYGPRTETTTWYISPATAAQDAPVTLGSGILLTTPGGRQLYVTATAPKGRKARWLQIEEGNRIEVVADADDSDVWAIARDEGPAQHPTQKPVALAGRAIANSSLPGQIVLDPFLGSGGTLIAAERAGRRCFGMELDPGIVDVAVQRWETETGRKAELDGLAGPEP